MEESPKILIVEDEKIIALDIKHSLENLGYVVIAIVSSGEKAIKKIEECRPDLVLMDIMLAGKLDGIETSQKIHQNYQTPIVYLTSHTDSSTVNRAKETSPFGYLVKPFIDQELYTIIEIALARSKAEADIKKALAKEKELNELKSQFISMVSHEFRTPMSTILFSAGLLETYSHQWSEDKKKIHLQRIQVCVKQMNELLNTVLMIGKIEAQKLAFKPASLNLEKFCQELIEDHKNSTNAQIYWICHGDFSNVVMDEILLRHIFNNLLANAIKYSPQESLIEFELTSQEINQACDLSQRFAIFRIKDQGIGIPQTDQENLFEPFYRASNVGKISGTGLGLAIVKRSVELHGGTINVTSQENVGTVFTVMLPFDHFHPFN